MKLYSSVEEVMTMLNNKNYSGSGVHTIQHQNPPPPPGFGFFVILRFVGLVLKNLFTHDKFKL